MADNQKSDEEWMRLRFPDVKCVVEGKGCVVRSGGTHSKRLGNVCVDAMGAWRSAAKRHGRTRKDMP